MLDFFINKPVDIQQAYRTYPKFNYIKSSYKDSIDNLVNYYNARSMVVNNRHLLCRIIDTTFPGLKLERIDYLRHVDINSRYVAKHFRLINNITVGEIKQNIFYKKNSYEIINHTEFDYDFLEVMNNYSKFTPLRVTYTEEKGFDFHLLNGTKIKDKPEITVFELDITLMLLMYRQWALKRRRFGLDVSSNRFVATIVIPNAIKSMVDLIIFNRFIEIANGRNLPEFTLKHPIYVLDYSRGVDDILKSVANDIVDNNMLLLNFINTIPTMYYPKMYNALRIHRQVYTRQSLWSIWIARLKYINTILDLLGFKGRNRNRLQITSLAYELRLLSSNNTPLMEKLREYPALLPEYVKVIEDIKNKIK